MKYQFEFNIYNICVKFVIAIKNNLEDWVYISGIRHQKVNKWMKDFLPQILKSAYKKR
jgi:hypothetical protein